MAFTSTIIGTGDAAGKRTVYGTYDCTAVTGGDVATGLQVVEFMMLQPTGTAVEANQAVINDAFPISDTQGDVTIVTNSGDAGIWMAIGY